MRSGTGFVSPLKTMNTPEASAGPSETIDVDDEVEPSLVKAAKKQCCVNVDDELPLQYADFFVLSAGKIDVRSTYHCADQIWPVGFKSCWHDNITGSLFVSEILDGGDPGPLFRVRRFPCCQSSIPIATTVLSDTARHLSDDHKETDGCVTTNNYDDYDEDDSVVPMLTDPCLPIVDDVLAPIGSAFDEFHASQLSKHAHQKTKPIVEKSESNDWLELRDEVGELFVEEPSSSLAWRSMARKFLNSCQEIVLGSSFLKLVCPHLTEGIHIGYRDRLLKFFSSSPCLGIPSLITKEKLNSLSCELLKWLEKDRFGLSEDFVQEVVEKLPDVHSSANYILLNQRDPLTSLITVKSGILNANVKGGADTYQMESRCLPLGKPICTLLSPKLLGDVFQVWQFLWRFRGLLGLDLPLSFVALEMQLIDPYGGKSDPVWESGSVMLPERTSFLSKDELTNYFLTKVHTSLLQALLGELESKLVAIIEPNEDAGDLKRKRGRKKSVDCMLASKVTNYCTLPLNELTWPELARRYLLALSLLDGNMNSSNWTYDTSLKVLQCLRGDGGVLCGSLDGIAAIGVDALILAEATRSIFGCLNRESDMLGIGRNVHDGNNSFENSMSDAGLPDWAEVLLPVQKLPTNVGSRIRNCVRKALEKSPPEWAREILENSIGKDVYKGNASGPTKRAALSVLSQALGEVSQPRPRSGKKSPSAKKRREKYISISSFMMKQCRVVLREAAAADEKKVVCYLMGRRLQTCGRDDGILGSKAVVSRPLDFRTIDIRLAAGAYHGSHEAFLEDVRELWMAIRTTYGENPDLLQLANKLSSNFESLYEQKVNAVHRELVKYSKLHNVSLGSTKKIEDLLHSVSTVNIPKAPWDEGICKVCGINRDDTSVLLCDGCNGAYHTYCLNPPLSKIPEGNWFCPFCISHRHPFNDASTRSQTIHELQKKCDGKYTRKLFEMINCLSNAMEKTDYWELRLNVRVHLLQFLCDEMLTSSPLRQHLETCAGVCDDLNTKLRKPSEYKTKLRSPSEYKTRNLKQDINYKKSILKSNDNGAPASCLECTDRWSSDISQGDKKTLGGKKVRGFHRGNLSVSMDHSEARSGDSELNSYKSNSQHWQISVNDREIQQEEMSLRSKFLGCDSAGRFYWAMVTPHNQISVIVSENKKLPGGKTTFTSAQDMSSKKGPPLGSMNGYRSPGGSNVPCPFTHEFSHDGSVSSRWVLFESDVEIKGLLDFLKDDYLCERQLRDSILKWQRRRFSKRQRFRKQEGPQFSSPLPQNFSQSDCSMSRAVNILEVKYGSFVESKAKSSSMLKGKAVGLDGMYRCECLEPVWPSRLHCSSCHKTFLLKVDVAVHDCQTAITVPVEDSLEGKDTINPGNLPEKYLDRICTRPESESNSMIPNQYHSDISTSPKLADICSKFVSECSNHELVKGVGLISSNGVPSFVPLESPYLSDPALKLDNYREDARCHISGDLPTEQIELSTGKISESRDPSSFPRNPPKHSVGPEANENSASFSHHYCGDFFMVPEASLRPLVGRASEVLRRIKCQLLDMDAALPEAALRVSKSQVERRWAWRSFVKSAQTIYEIVQAMVVLEDSIKAEYLSDSWLRWSSLSAAAKISTLSALALRLYSLDASIQYERTSPKERSSKQKKREKSTLDKKSNKKRKEDSKKGSK
ncbi:hypothetical protein Leryth_024346 [Lithospermum erythrorhizon]|nr:hypothetical protein Leryth_024346 [Lithospermum erythrorhizon]